MPCTPENDANNNTTCWPGSDAGSQGFLSLRPRRSLGVRHYPHLTACKGAQRTCPGTALVRGQAGISLGQLDAGAWVLMNPSVLGAPVPPKILGRLCRWQRQTRPTESGRGERHIYYDWRHPEE